MEIGRALGQEKLKPQFKVIYMEPLMEAVKDAIDTKQLKEVDYVGKMILQLLKNDKGSTIKDDFEKKG